MLFLQYNHYLYSENNKVMFKKINPLILFVLLYLLIWVGVTLLIHNSYSISPDTAENMMWGMNPSLMYDKHPGLGPLFLIPFTYFFNPLLANLLANTFCILITWLFLYKTLKIYFCKKEAIFVTLLSITSFFYMGEFFLQYNQNIILLPFWSAGVYFFIKSLYANNSIDWIFTAIALALGVYAKFEIGLLAIAMMVCLVIKFDRRYLKNIFLATTVGTLFLLPGFISLLNIDFATLKYVAMRVSESNNSAIYNFFYAIFDSFFQLLNFSIGIIVISYLFYKKKMYKEDSSNDKKVLIILGIIPYLIFCFLETIKGMLPTEWLVCATVFVLPAVYSIFKVRILDINLYKLVSLITIVNIVYFISFNLNTFINQAIEHNNIGDSVALSAERFLKMNNLAEPQNASGNWNYSLYLPVFMKSKPNYVREWQQSNVKGTMLLVYPSCNMGIDAGKYGYKLIKKECGNIKLIDKFKTQHKTFSFYFVEKNSGSVAN